MKAEILALLLVAQPFPSDGGFKAQREVFHECLRKNTEKFAVLCEPAEFLATAIRTSCYTEFQSLVDELRKMSPSLTPADIDGLARDMEKNYTDGIITVLMQKRLDNPCPSQ